MLPGVTDAQLQWTLILLGLMIVVAANLPPLLDRWQAVGRARALPSVTPPAPPSATPPLPSATQGVSEEASTPPPFRIGFAPDWAPRLGIVAHPDGPRSFDWRTQPVEITILVQNTSPATAREIGYSYAFPMEVRGPSTRGSDEHGPLYGSHPRTGHFCVRYTDAALHPESFASHRMQVTFPVGDACWPIQVAIIYADHPPFRAWLHVHVSMVLFPEALDTAESLKQRVHCRLEWAMFEAEREQQRDRPHK